MGTGEESLRALVFSSVPHTAQTLADEGEEALAAPSPSPSPPLLLLPFFSPFPHLFPLAPWAALPQAGELTL